jgi:hypothetical protein
MCWALFWAIFWQTPLVTLRRQSTSAQISSIKENGAHFCLAKLKHLVRHFVSCPQTITGRQSYEFELQRQRCKNLQHYEQPSALRKRKYFLLLCKKVVGSVLGKTLAL